MRLASVHDALAASASRTTPGSICGLRAKKALFLAPKCILLHHSAGGWM